jgi:hypothetical protein
MRSDQAGAAGDDKLPLGDLHDCSQFAWLECDKRRLTANGDGGSRTRSLLILTGTVILCRDFRNNFRPNVTDVSMVVNC